MIQSSATTPATVPTDRWSAPFAPYADLLGRIGVASLFAVSGYGKLTGYANTAKFMASKSVPMIEVLLPLTIAIELACALGLVLGAWTRAAALVLFLWMVPVTLTFHAYWTIEASQQPPQRTHFMKNMAIAGGLLVIFAMGAGPLSLDAKRRRAS